MKLVIPVSVKAGHLNYKILFADKVLQIADVRAQVNHTQQEIRLSKYGTYKASHGIERSSAVLLEFLMHEILHIHNNLWCGGELTEQQTEAISAGLAQSLMSLGIEPDFSQIPEEEL